MLRKFILPLVLLIFTQQVFYGMEEGKDDIEQFNTKQEEDSTDWESINNWVNVDWSDDTKSYPKLWWLWAILDNVTCQYGNSKIWKTVEGIMD